MENFLNTLKKMKTVDLIIIVGVLIALAVGFVTYKNFRQTASKQIEATSKISFDVFLRGITFTGSTLPIKENEKTFISIRNVPYSDLNIMKVKAERKKMILPVLNTKNAKSSKTIMIVEDVSQANVYDVIVTLTDTAKITKDGAVVGGNKIKMGLPITLEGKDYKFNGTVSNVQLIQTSEKNNVINNQPSAAENVQ